MSPRARLLAAIALPVTLLLAACGGDEAPSEATTGSSGDTTSTSGAGGGSSATTGAGGGSSSTGAGGDTSSTTGTGGSGWVPDPIPAVSDDPPAACQDAIDDPYYFQFLDDVCKAKKYPSVLDRDRACPVLDGSPVITLADGTTVTYEPSSSPVTVDGEALKGLVPDDLNVTVILIRRVGGVPHYRYLSNGSHDLAYQPWSTTKFLAAANAASLLRIQSGYAVGLTASVDGLPLGDLVTSVVNYDSDPYSSNSLGRYFHNIGGRARANDLIHALWLTRPAGETFGGNYGEAAPPLGYTFVEPAGPSVAIQPDQSAGPANKLSSFTMAEALKRLVLHREEANQRLPGIQWKDLRVLFYGAEGSAKYGPFGGMSADTSIYLQSGHDIDYLEKRSHGQWRIFSKLGLGTQGQFASVGYACLPVLDDQGMPVPGLGARGGHLGPPRPRWGELEGAGSAARDPLSGHRQEGGRRPAVTPGARPTGSLRAAWWLVSVAFSCPLSP
jgi:hypothetical protein